MAETGPDSETPEWPEVPVPPGARSTVESFYRLVDTESLQVFRQWTALFVPDGQIEIGPKKLKGHEGQYYYFRIRFGNFWWGRQNFLINTEAALEKERQASWTKIGSRKHSIYRVYTSKAAGTDLLVIGRVDIGVRNRTKFSQEFAQNFVLVEAEGQYLIRKFQAWIDSAPLTAAVAGMSTS